MFFHTFNLSRVALKYSIRKKSEEKKKCKCVNRFSTQIINKTFKMQKYCSVCSAHNIGRDFIRVSNNGKNHSFLLFYFRCCCCCSYSYISFSLFQTLLLSNKFYFHSTFLFTHFLHLTCSAFVELLTFQWKIMCMLYNSISICYVYYNYYTIYACVRINIRNPNGF